MQSGKGLIQLRFRAHAVVRIVFLFELGLVALFQFDLAPYHNCLPVAESAQFRQSH
jgi:hypothetical protein